MALAALIAAAGCAAPQYGEGETSGVRLSSPSVPRFGSAVIAVPAATPEPPAAETSEPESAAPEASAVSDAAPATVPTVQAKPEEDAAPGRSAEPRKPEAPGESAMAAASRHRPEELIGLTPAKVTELLGDPSLVRRDRPAQVWQYRARDCVLDLYLYPPAAGTARAGAQTVSEAERTVVYYELRAKDAKRLAGDRCFISIVAARGGRPG